MCFVIYAASIHGDQKSCGPIRNKVCCLGGVSIPPLFKGSSHNITVFIEKRWFSEERKKNNDVCVSATRSQQLCVKLEPRGLLYVKLSLQEKWDAQVDESAACVHCCSVTTVIRSHCLLMLLSPSAAHQDHLTCLEWSYTTSWRRKSPPSPSLCSSRSV